MANPLKQLFGALRKLVDKLVGRRTVVKEVEVIKEVPIIKEVIKEVEVPVEKIVEKKVYRIKGLSYGHAGTFLVGLLWRTRRYRERIIPLGFGSHKCRIF